jgi:cation diffusion facilitator CzcD-associated flavoprotein CzcO
MLDLEEADTLDVVIVGAGPYGLSIASHLRATEARFRIFGQPMRFWREMPAQMFLKSLGFATTISNPERLRFDAWCRERGLEDREPCGISAFCEYGMWVQKQLVPEVEPVDVTHIARAGAAFRVALASGEAVEARQVVVAVGLRYFQRMPRALAALPQALASHTAQHPAYGEFAGKAVCVVGAGQSALEAAVLLSEAGANVRLLVRGAGPVFHGRTARKRSLLRRVKAPLTVLGEGRLNWVLQHFPLAPFFLPDDVRVRFARKHLGPAGSWWLRPRFEGKIPVHARCEIVDARPAGSGVVLRVVEDGAEREISADHVVCGTGYEVDVDRLPFLDADLRGRIDRIERAPRLDRHFQSSVPGLYFVGVSSMFSFGPLFRFVAGTAYAAPTVARHLARQAQRAPVAAVKPELAAGG